VGKFAATEEKSGGMRIDVGAARQKAHDSSVIIKTTRRGNGAGRRRYDQILETAFSGGAPVLSG
jgi:hypothetical protein